jgi:hypothetical protein
VLQLRGEVVVGAGLAGVGVKVFFADGGSLEQLRATLTTIAETAEARLEELHEKVEEHESGVGAFPERLHINAIGLRFHLDHERSIGTWARWALDQTAEWKSTTDPGEWDHRRAYSHLPG